MSALDDKRALVGVLRERLGDDLAIARKAAETTKAGVTHEEAKPENDKDTRAIEAGYLAGAQAGRVRAIELAMAVISALPLREFGADDPAALGAVVEVERDDGKVTRYFLAPEGGGIEATYAGAPVYVVTPSSPIGAALVGQREGDEPTVQLQGKKRTLTIVRVGLRTRSAKSAVENLAPRARPRHGVGMSPLASLVASESRRLRSTIPPPASGIFASRSLSAVAAELYLEPLSIPTSEELDAPPTDIDDLLSAMHDSVHEMPTYRP